MTAYSFVAPCCSVHVSQAVGFRNSDTWWSSWATNKYL